jgi:His-Xaa-Ser system protein HxsD
LHTEASVLVDEAVYSKDAVLRAAYWFTDRCNISISSEGPGRLKVSFASKDGASSVDDLVAEFNNSLIDHQLRVELDRETRPLRELIVAKAFAEGSELDDPPVGDDRDPVELGVADSPAVPKPEGS